jgi:tellurite resistance protein
VIDTDLIQRMRDQLVAQGRPATTEACDVDVDAQPFEQASLERVTPLAELLFLMMAADGDQDRRELDAIRGAVRTLTDGLLRTAVADELVEGFRGALARDGHARRLGAVTAHLAADRDDAEVGALLAAAVALADGEVDAEEHELFELVTQELGISRRRMDELLGR